MAKPSRSTYIPLGGEFRHQLASSACTGNRQNVAAAHHIDAKKPPEWSMFDDESWCARDQGCTLRTGISTRGRGYVTTSAEPSLSHPITTFALDCRHARVYGCFVFFLVVYGIRFHIQPLTILHHQRCRIPLSRYPALSFCLFPNWRPLQPLETLNTRFRHDGSLVLMVIYARTVRA